MTCMRINYFVAAVAVAFMAAAPAADAQVIQHPLSDLVAGGSSADGIAITDPLRPGYGWRFSEFTFRSTESVPVSAGDVVIRTSPADATGRGALNFVYAGELQPAEVGRSIGFLVGYRAEVVGPDPIA